MKAVSAVRRTRVNVAPKCPTEFRGASLEKPVARVFSFANDNGWTRFGEQEIYINMAVEKIEGRPLSAYSAAFGCGERAELPAPYDEIWVVFHGRIRVGDRDNVVEAKAGDYVHVPEQTPGEVVAMEDTHIVCVSAPAH